MASSKVPILLLDGGLGTTLKDDFNAAVDGTSRPLWSSHLLISAPDILQAAQTAFADAGADVILTATYQASYEGFASTRVDHPGESNGSGVGKEEAERYMRNAVGIARKAFGGNQGKVALSLGAYGAIMVPSQEYSGKYDENHGSVEQLKNWHSDRISLFAEDPKTWSNVDLVAFETLPLLTEVSAVRETVWQLEKSGKQKPFWISCVFPGEADNLPDGSSVKELVKAMLGHREHAALPYAIGLNCTKTGKIAALTSHFEEAVQDLLNAGEITEWPALVVYPDGTRGEVYNTTTHEWEKKGDDANLLQWDHTISNIIESIVSKNKWSAILVGGCCKTGPAEIAALRKRLDQQYSSDWWRARAAR